MEEYIYQIRNYLPIKFLDNEANDFLRYLEEAYLVNTEKEKYQFAFTAFHMLYMVFIYKIQWFLKQEGNSRIETDLNNYIASNRRAIFNSLFDLSQIPEKNSLEGLLQALNFHVNEIGICKNHVDIRNNCLHSSGKIYYRKNSQVSTYIEEEIESAEKIHNKIFPELKELFEKFIELNWNKKIDVQDWITVNYLSQKDLESLVLVDLPFLKDKSDTQEIIFKKILNIVFISEVQKLIEVNNDLIITKLSSFMDRLPLELDVVNGDGEQKKILTQEIIEGYLIPIISQFDHDNRQKAESILNL